MTAEQRAKKAARNKRYYEKHKDKLAGHYRKSHLKCTYGITPERYEELKEAQNNGCAICGTIDPGNNGDFSVDHCHTTGEVRGLLCNGCNVGLGHFKDNPAALRQAAAYLEASAKCQ